MILWEKSCGWINNQPSNRMALLGAQVQTEIICLIGCWRSDEMLYICMSSKVNKQNQALKIFVPTKHSSSNSNNQPPRILPVGEEFSKAFILSNPKHTKNHRKRGYTSRTISCWKTYVSNSSEHQQLTWETLTLPGPPDWKKVANYTPTSQPSKWDQTTCKRPYGHKESHSLSRKKQSRTSLNITQEKGCWPPKLNCCQSLKTVINPSNLTQIQKRPLHVYLTRRNSTIKPNHAKLEPLTLQRSTKQ